MENKKTKLTISGKPKKLFKNFDNKKSQSKNNDMPILAKTPPINNSSIFGSLSKSIKSYLNF